MRGRGPGRPKHRQIADSLREEILSGKYAAGTCLPSELQLVKRFAVSRPPSAARCANCSTRG